MEIFQLHPTTYAPLGEIVSGIDSVSWIERYNKPNEFKITGKPHPLMESLPIDAFITHSKTNVVMQVETHIIDESEDGPPKLVITGRDPVSIAMENRAILTNGTDEDIAWTNIDALFNNEFLNYLIIDASTYPMEYYTDAAVWHQVSSLINRYLVNTDMGLLEDLPNVELLVVGDIAGSSHEVPQRPRVFTKRPLVSTVVYDLLQSYDIGLTVSRPTASLGDNFYIIIHVGEDRSGIVTFSDLASARYVWSSKNDKSGYYSGIDGYTVKKYSGDLVGWDFRMASIDSSDWTPPGTYTDDEIYQMLESRGADYLNKTNHKGKIVEATVRNSVSPHLYGVDYNMGDRVFIQGNYEIGSTMRLVEHAIAVDEASEEFIQTFRPIFVPEIFYDG